MNYNSQTLLDVKFTKNVKGYDALEVDETLDDVIADYKKYEKASKESELTIADLRKEIDELKEKNLKQEVEIKKLKKAVEDIPEGPEVNRNNIQYLKRIADLEKALYKKGVDPKKI